MSFLPGEQHGAGWTSPVGETHAHRLRGERRNLRPGLSAMQRHDARRALLTRNGRPHAQPTADASAEVFGRVTVD